MFEFISATCLAAGALAGIATYIVMSVIGKLIPQKGSRRGDY